MSDIHNLSVIEPPVRLYFSGHEQTSPSHACGPGIWPHYLLHYVLSGTGTFQSEKQSWRLTAGDAFLIIPGVVSAYAASSTDPWEYCWIGFDGRDAADILSACGISGVISNGQQPEKLYDIIAGAPVGTLFKSGRRSAFGN